MWIKILSDIWLLFRLFSVLSCKINLNNKTKYELFFLCLFCLVCILNPTGAIVATIDVSWIYNYLCNQCLLTLMLWVRITLRRGVLDTTLCDKVCQWLATGRWFSPCTTVSSTNKTDRHDTAEKLLEVALNTITPPPLTLQ